MGKRHQHKLGRGCSCLATTCEDTGREFHQRDQMRKMLESIISNPGMFLTFLKFVQEYAKSMHYPCSTSDDYARELHTTSISNCKTMHVDVCGKGKFGNG